MRRDVSLAVKLVLSEAESVSSAAGLSLNHQRSRDALPEPVNTSIYSHERPTDRQPSKQAYSCHAVEPITRSA